MFESQVRTAHISLSPYFLRLHYVSVPFCTQCVYDFTKTLYCLGIEMLFTAWPFPVCASLQNFVYFTFMAVAHSSSVNSLSFKICMLTWYNFLSYKVVYNFSFRKLEPNFWHQKIDRTTIETFQTSRNVLETLWSTRKPAMMIRLVPIQILQPVSVCAIGFMKTL